MDNASDVIVEVANQGIDTIQSSVNQTLGDNLENIVLLGTTGITGTGNSLDNSIIGNSAGNTLKGLAGNDTLDGGAGADRLEGGAGDDIYVVDNSGDVLVEAANSGTDTVNSSISLTLGDNVERLVLLGSAAINATGNSLDNVLTGNGAANTLNGGAGSDSLFGLAGDDTLDGGASFDRMEGGTGNDTYIVDAADLVVEAVDGGTDTVKASISFTLIDNVENLLLLGSSAINGTGNGLNNTLTGNSGANTLTGLDGDDTLDGAAGADTLDGGIGNDTYIVDNADDQVVEAADSGSDTVRSSISLTLGDNVENLLLQLGSAAVIGTGNALDNSLTGNAGANTLSGLAGNDTLNGGEGADTLDGGTGNDIYFVDNAGDVVVEAADDGTDTVRSSITLTLGAELENLVLLGSDAIDATGNGANNTLTGNSDANSLNGAAGNDTLKGLAGNDTLNGGAGADTLDGGTGDDIYVIDDAGDVAVEAANAGTDTVRSSITLTLGDNLETLVLLGSAAINGTGTSASNTITGNSGANVLNGAAGNDTLNGLDGNDTLDGGAGADQMEGGIGNDTYVVDNVTDSVAEAAKAGSDTVRSTITFTLGANVEKLALLGSAALNGTGNDAANTLTGNAGINRLNGADGNDTLSGNDGNDFLTGGIGADRLSGGAGADDFVFRSLAETTNATDGRDTILDFIHGQGDDIALSAIDANTKSSGNQAFSFIGDDAFSGKAGELRFLQTKGDTIVQGDVNGDGRADFSMCLDATIDLVKGDFIL